MKITRNPEVVALFRNCAVIFLVFIIMAVSFTFISIRHLQNTVLENHAALVGVVTQHYPEAEQEIIRQIRHPEPQAMQRGQEALSRYGVDTADNFLYTRFLQSNFRINLGLYLLLAALACSSFILLVNKFLRKQYGEIHKVSQYTQTIRNGDFSLDIRDNSEGDISTLKNEIYKITTMLNEQAAALQHDKIILADSMADISHQLKTPLTSLLMISDFLTENPADDVKEKFHDRLKSQLKRIEWLVSSLLTLSKLDAGTLSMKKETIDVRLLLDKTLETVGIPLEIKMQEVNIMGDDNSKFTGDFNWSREALMNILKNCIEHTPEKGRIKISFSENPIFTEIIIKDNGVGINKEELPYIFNRFYKGKNSSDDSVGIGLAMARAIVDKQGGDITVNSEEGKGSEFTVKFYKNAT